MKKILLINSLLLYSTSSFAMSLQEALAEMYQSNPEIIAARANAKATDENIIQARSGWAPSLNANYQYTWTDPHKKKNSTTNIDNNNFGVNLTLNVFNGLSTLYGSKSAKDAALSSHADLYNIEQNMMLQGISVYVNYITAVQAVEISKKNMNSLEKQLRNTQIKFDSGIATLSDLNLAKSRYYEAKTNVISSEGSLETAKAKFLEVIGKNPENITEPAIEVKELPTDLNSLLRMAEEFNPSIIAANWSYKSSENAKRSKIGSFSPSVNLFARYSNSIYGSNYVAVSNDNESVQIGVEATINLYRGGIDSSIYRQASLRASSLYQQGLKTIRNVRQEASKSWTDFSTNRSKIETTKSQVSAAEVALYATMQEYEAGSRTLVELIDSENELLKARLAELEARTNYIISYYTVKKFSGDLTAKKLNLKVNYYDPTVYMKSVENNYFGRPTNPQFKDLTYKGK